MHEHIYQADDDPSMHVTVLLPFVASSLKLPEPGHIPKGLTSYYRDDYIFTVLRASSL